MANPIDCTKGHIAQIWGESKYCRNAARAPARPLQKSAAGAGEVQGLPLGPPAQSCLPGSGERYCSLSGTPSHSFASDSGSLRSVMFGQTLA